MRMETMNMTECRKHVYTGIAAPQHNPWLLNFFKMPKRMHKMPKMMSKGMPKGLHHSQNVVLPCSEHSTSTRKWEQTIQVLNCESFCPFHIKLNQFVPKSLLLSSFQSWWKEEITIKRMELTYLYESIPGSGLWLLLFVVCSMSAVCSRPLLMHQHSTILSTTSFNLSTIQYSTI